MYKLLSSNKGVLICTENFVLTTEEIDDPAVYHVVCKYGGESYIMGIYPSVELARQVIKDCHVHFRDGYKSFVFPKEAEFTFYR